MQEAEHGWDRFVLLAETEPDLVHSTEGHEESQALHSGSRLLRIRRDRLNWPGPCAG